MCCLPFWKGLGTSPCSASDFFKKTIARTAAGSVWWQALGCFDLAPSFISSFELSGWKKWLDQWEKQDGASISILRLGHVPLCVAHRSTYGKRQRSATLLHISLLLALVVLFTEQVLLLLLLSICFYRRECCPLRSSCGGHMLLFSLCFRKVLASVWFRKHSFSLQSLKREAGDWHFSFKCLPEFTSEHV